MNTIMIDILNDEALKKLEDLENEKMIRLHREDVRKNSFPDWENKYKGSMKQQTLTEIDRQLNELRNAWE